MRTVNTYFITKEVKDEIFKWFTPPHIIPIARIMSNKGELLGFKVYNIELNNTYILNLGEILQLNLEGVAVAGISLRVNYKDSISKGMLLLDNICIDFDTNCFDYRYLTEIDKDGKVIKTGLNIIAGMDEHEDFVVINYNGEVEKTVSCIELHCENHVKYISISKKDPKEIAITALQKFKGVI